MLWLFMSHSIFYEFFIPNCYELNDLRRGDLVKKKLSTVKKTLAYEILIMPALIIFILFIVYPAFSTIYYSFTNWTDINPNNYKLIGFDNYIRLFKDKAILIGIKNSFTFAFAATFFTKYNRSIISPCTGFEI